ncbi:twin-arginine translocase TatA/TatE family subunit [Sphingomonas sp.]|jgi:sec-independent protein translocase protein TatA|uniref:twin-arginine translocase TatA/TatE family subunit n=1 Tax=Sphingomonas sp. TaxID=28214 RepID=UPI002D7F9326|nr:twin-arginine translocase TatA/TatE family subunit [Sphingomonas sp.]HEU0044326.1 twin-arginine translocase TatA/TatE family subunit [Sphingomonas sp.]
MGGFSPIHLLILAVVAILLLGGGRFSSLMGDVAKGVKNFKRGMSEEDTDPAKPASRIEGQKGAEPAFDRDGNRVRDEQR